MCPFWTGLWALGEGLWHGDCHNSSGEGGIVEEQGLVGVPLPLPDDPLSSEMDMALQHHTYKLKLKMVELRKQRLLVHLHLHCLAITLCILNYKMHLRWNSKWALILKISEPLLVFCIRRFRCYRISKHPCLLFCIWLKKTTNKNTLSISSFIQKSCK